MSGFSGGSSGFPSGAWTPYTATATPASGAITTQSSSSAYLVVGKTVFVRIAVTISNVGTASGNPSINLPPGMTLAGVTTLVGREAGVGGNLLQGVGGAGASGLQIFNYNNSTVSWANGIQLTLDGVFERQ